LNEQEISSLKQGPPKPKVQMNMEEAVLEEQKLWQILEVTACYIIAAES